MQSLQKKVESGIMSTQHIHDQSHSAPRNFKSGIELANTLETNVPPGPCKPLVQFFIHQGLGREKTNANWAMGKSPTVHHSAFFLVVDDVDGCVAAGGVGG